MAVAGVHQGGAGAGDVEGSHVCRFRRVARPEENRAATGAPPGERGRLQAVCPADRSARQALERDDRRRLDGAVPWMLSAPDMVGLSVAVKALERQGVVRHPLPLPPLLVGAMWRGQPTALLSAVRELIAETAAHYQCHRAETGPGNTAGSRPARFRAKGSGQSPHGMTISPRLVIQRDRGRDPQRSQVTRGIN